MTKDAVGLEMAAGTFILMAANQDQEEAKESEDVCSLTVDTAVMGTTVDLLMSVVVEALLTTDWLILTSTAATRQCQLNWRTIL